MPKGYGTPDDGLHSRQRAQSCCRTVWRRHAAGPDRARCRARRRAVRCRPRPSPDGKAIDLAANKRRPADAGAARHPAIIALSLVTATYARLY